MSLMLILLGCPISSATAWSDGTAYLGWAISSSLLPPCLSALHHFLFSGSLPQKSGHSGVGSWSTTDEFNLN